MWTKCAQIWTKWIWTKTGPLDLDQMWSCTKRGLVSNVVPFWTRFRSGWDQCQKFGPVLDQFGTSFKPSLDQFQSRFRPSLNQLWNIGPGLNQVLDHLQTRFRPVTTVESVLTTVKYVLTTVKCILTMVNYVSTTVNSVSATVKCILTTVKSQF